MQDRDTWDPGGCSYSSVATWSTSGFKQWDPGVVILSPPFPSGLKEEWEHLMAQRSRQQRERDVFVKWKTLFDLASSWESLAIMKEHFPSLLLEDKENFQGGSDDADPNITSCLIPTSSIVSVNNKPKTTLGCYWKKGKEGNLSNSTHL